MKSIKIRFTLIGLVSAWILLACNLVSPDAVNDPGMKHTQAAETISVILTETQMAATATDIPPLPTATNTYIPTATKIPPKPTATATSIPCDWAQFIKDVTVQDDTLFPPGAEFTKTWRIKNIGSCTWTKDYDLVFVSGDGLNAYASVPFPETAVPGETIDLSVRMTAPAEGGDYKGFWRLRNANGVVFGIDWDAKSAFWVDIEVLDVDFEAGYHFALNYCLANWRTGQNVDVSCPTSSETKKGFVQLLSRPELENRREDEPTLWTHPDYNINGWITGTYPAIDIEDGNRFRAWVGCLDDSNGCNVRFDLSYQINFGVIQTLAQWEEVYDGEVTNVDVDLSSLAGESVQFILSVVVIDGKSANANAFWFNPHIRQ